MIHLEPHNQETYEEVCDFYKTSKRCAICNATGTGKSSIIMQVMEDFNNNKNTIILIAPRDLILKQFEIYGVSPEQKNIKLMTYSKVYKLWKTKQLNYINCNLIICDELHRTGAPLWEKAVLHLLHKNPAAYLLGATATPRRFDQKGQENDMVDILFGGNRAGNIDLVAAIKRGILPKPTYVASLYSLNEIIKKEKEKLEKFPLDENTKKEIYDLFREAEIKWENSFHYGTILEKHLKPLYDKNKCLKILLFCKNINHVSEIRKAFDPIFKRIFKQATIFEISEYHSRTSEIPFIKFRDNNETGAVKILYSVDKLDEGAHLPNLRAAILLRETQSDIIYHQQIGRVLSIKGSENPLIIDFVNNFKRIQNYTIWHKLLNPANISEKRDPYNITDIERDKKVYFYDYTPEAIEIFEEVKERVEDIKLPYKYNGEKGTVGFFAQKYNKEYSEIRRKLKNGFTIKEAIETSEEVDSTIIEYAGEKNTLRYFSRKFKKQYQLVKYQYNKGKDLEEIFET